MVKPLNIGILMQPDDNWMGGILYIQNLMKSIAGLPLNKRSHIKIFLFTRPRSNNNYLYSECTEDIVEEIFKANCLEPSILNRFRWKVGDIIPWLRDRRLIKLLDGAEMDFAYPVPCYRGVSWDLKCGWSTWVPDLQHKYLPSFFPSKEIKSRDSHLKYLSDNSKNIVFSSKCSLKDFTVFYPESKARKFVLSFKTSPNQSWFATHSDPELVQGKYHLPNCFFLVSNQFWVHKNHKLIIEALCLLKRKDIKPVIVCTGGLHDYRFHQYGQEIKRRVGEGFLNDQFIILGLISRWDQIQLMRRSLAVIQASLFEGWSAVVEDARLLGKTILLSDLPVHREQNPPRAVFFNPNSSQELANHMELLMNKLSPGPDLTAELEAKSRNKLECQAYAEEFLSVVQKIVS